MPDEVRADDRPGPDEGFYHRCLESCPRLGVEPVTQERVEQLVGEWHRIIGDAIAGRENGPGERRINSRTFTAGSRATGQAERYQKGRGCDMGAKTAIRWLSILWAAFCLPWIALGLAVLLLGWANGDWLLLPVAFWIPGGLGLLLAYIVAGFGKKVV